jgi:spore germination protein GerM
MAFLSKKSAVSLLLGLGIGLGGAYFYHPKPPATPQQVDNAVTPTVEYEPEQAQHTVTLRVFFSKAKGSDVALEGIARKEVLKTLGFKESLRLAVSDLIKGPSQQEQAEGYFSEIPPETKILNIQETSGRLVLNLSHHFSEGGGSDSLTQRLKQLSKTARFAGNGKAVYLEIEGETPQTIGDEGLEVPQPLASAH